MHRNRKRSQFKRLLQFQTLERRDLMASAFMNHLDGLDVDQDGGYSPLDVLAVVNYINSKGSGALPSTRPADEPLVDTDGDKSLSPLDALVIINQINREGSSSSLTRRLVDANGIVTEAFVTIGTAQPTGSRKYELSIDATLDSPTGSAIGDHFGVYVVGKSNPDESLLSRGIAGSPIFTMTGQGAVITPGITIFDGKVLTIDLTSITEDVSVLKLQLINHDASSKSRVSVTPMSNTVDTGGSAFDRLNIARSIVAAGASTNTASMTIRPNASVKVSEVQLSSTGNYEADIVIVNSGESLGRDTVVVLNGFPSSVSVENASGVTSTGLPYINFRGGIASGGLGNNERSNPIRLKIKNPSGSQFAIVPTVYSGLANRAPLISPIADLTIKPGQKLTVKFDGQDPDGDLLSYSVRNSSGMPTSELQGDELVFSPTPTQIGEYQFEVVASDGSFSTTRIVKLAVIADPITTTRLSGKIADVSGAPIVGLRVEVGSQQALTQSDGSFLIDLGVGDPTADTLRVRAELLAGRSYPFIAEKLALLLEHPVYAGFNNQILRPIFLPTLNAGTTVNPAITQSISQQLATNEAPVQVQISAGSLFTQLGTPFTGSLSITEVPVDLTPAALPQDLFPDLVVTIQPGEMSFATPAALTLPNRSRYAPGVILNLWSINPTSGQFDDVGDMRVSADGLRIETISGGVRNSSWHFASPPPPPPNAPGDTPQNKDNNCACGGSGGSGGNGNGDAGENPGNDNGGNCPSDDSGGQSGSDGGGSDGGGGGGGCEASAAGGSAIELHSGALREWHELVSYQSLNKNRSWTLNYNSERANPAINAFASYDEVVAQPNRRLVARLEVDRGGLSIAAGGNPPGGFGLAGGERFWKLEQTGPVVGGIQFDAANLTTGNYRATMTSGFMQFANGRFAGSTTSQSFGVTVVNSVDSVFGSGWGLGGLLQLVENPDGSTLLVNGNGTQLLFGKNAAGQYDSPPGDFSVLSKTSNGGFQRIHKNSTTELFDRFGFLISVTDRVGNITRFNYAGPGAITSIVDPVGLETSFIYSGPRISEIVEPAGRRTKLEHDSNGNLVRITDPDGTSRAWNYNQKHFMTGEVDKRGFVESVEYNQHGQVVRTQIGDRTIRYFASSQSQGLANRSSSLDPDQAPAALANLTAFASHTDGNGNLRKTELNALGQAVTRVDSVGPQSLVRRNSENLVSEIIDTRGNVTRFKYDDRGNIVSIEDEITGFTLAPTIRWISDTSGLWSNPTNWSTGVVPGPNDVVEINRPNAQTTITISGQIVTVRAIVIAETLVLNNATLQISERSRIQGGLQLDSNSRMNIIGTVLTVVGAATLTDSQFNATNGSVVRFDGQTTSSNTRFTMDRSSRLVAPGITNADGSLFTSNAGSTIQLPSLSSYKGPTSLFNETRKLFSSNGLGSTIELSGLLSIEAVFSGLGALREVIETTDGGAIDLSNLKTLNAGGSGANGGGPFEFRQSGGTIDLSKLETISGSNVGVLFTISNPTYSLPALKTATRTNFTISGAGQLNLPLITSLSNSRVTAIENRIINAPSLTQFLTSSLDLSGGSQFNTGTLTSINESTFSLSAGAVFVLPSNIVTYNALAALAGNEQRAVFLARGIGTRIDLSSLTSIDGVFGGLGGIRQIIEASDSGTIDLSNLKTLNAGGSGANGGGPFEFKQNGGTIDLSKLETITGVNVGVLFTISNPTYSLPALKTATRTNFTNPVAGQLNLPLLTSLSNSRVTAIENRIINAPSLTQFLTSSLELSGGSQFITGTLSSIDESTFTLSAGAVFVLPSNIVTYKALAAIAGNEQRTLFSVRGNGTLIDLSSLTSIDGIFGGLGGIRQIVEASDSGTIDLSNLKTLNAGGSGANGGGPFEFKQNGGTINLSKLETITGSNVGVLFTVANSIYSLPALKTATRTNFVIPIGGQLNLPMLTTLSGSSVNATENRIINSPLLTQFSTSSLELAGGSQFNTGTLASINESTFSLSGCAIFVLPSNIITYKALASVDLSEKRIVFSARGAGTRIDLSSLTSIDAVFSGLGGIRQFIEASDSGQIDLSNLKTLNAGGSGPNGGGPFEFKLSGGTINLSKLETITGSNVGVQFTVTNPILDLSSLSSATRTRFTISAGSEVTARKLTSLANSNIDLASSSRIFLSDVAPVIATTSTISLQNGSEVQAFGFDLRTNSTLTGTGRVIGNVTNQAKIDPGSTQPGTITIDGNLVQTSLGTMQVNIVGDQPGTGYDQIVVSGSATIGGQLSVTVASTFSPTVGTMFTPLIANSSTGQFATVTGLSLSGEKSLEVNYIATGFRLSTKANGEGELYNDQLTPGPVVAPVFQAPIPMEIQLQLRYGPLMATLADGEDSAEGEAAPAQPREYQYDAVFSQLVRSTDENGHITLFGIDPANGNRLSRREVVGFVDSVANGETNDVVTRYTYTARGQMDIMTDPLGRITDYDYDQFGRVITVTSAKGTADEAVTRFEYDSAGNTTATIDPNGNRTEFQFDSMNRVVKTIEADPDGSGSLTSPMSFFEYNADGNLTKATDALQHTTTNRFDARSRMIETTGPDPDGTGALPAPVTKLTYDAADNVKSVVDPLNNLTQYRYDARNRRIESIDPDGGKTAFAYDFDNNLVKLTDPVGNVTQFAYDARDRQTQETDPLGKPIRYAYDGADNLIEKTDRNGRLTLFSNDDRDRLTRETWAGGNNTINYSYDSADNLLAANDSFSSLAFTYDSLDRVKSVDNQGTPNFPRVVASYAYDDAGNVTSMTDTINGLSGATNSYSFDALNRLEQETQAGNGIQTKRVEFDYNALGQYTSLNRFNDLIGTQSVIATGYSYDGQNRLSFIDHRGAANQVHESFGYSYDVGSRITQIVEKDQPIDYGYDKRDQLVSAKYGDAARTDEAFKFDANGNRVESNAHGTSYRTGPGNRLTTDGVYNYAYDAEGNLTKRTEIATGSTREFQWDHRNRLTMLSDKNASGVLQQVVRYSYDSFGRRISKQVDTTPLDTVDAAIEQYVYDGEDVILDFVDPDGSGPAASQQTTRYLRGPGIDNLLAIESASGTNWVLQDHLGSTRALVSSGGILVQSIDYDSFGKAIVTGSPSTRYLYTGRELDAESGLLYYRARYYDSSTGRFTNEDPIGFEGGSWNIQIYVDNSPIFFRDPFGTAVTVAAEVGGGIWYVCRSNPGLCRTAAQGIIQAISTPDPGVCESDPTLFEEHKKKRPSTKGRHQSGASRRGRDGGGEKGDEKRRPPRTPPDDHKGPWPRKS